MIVLDAKGRKIPWTEVSHIDDDEMRELMKDIVNRLYTFQMRIDDPEFQAWIDRWDAVSRKWDEPELSWAFAQMIELADKTEPEK